MTRSKACSKLIEWFSEGVSAVDPDRVTARVLGEGALEAGALHVLSIGKAALPMARAVLRVAPERVVGGLVVTPASAKDASLPSCRVLPASHPVPDETSAEAGRAVREYVRSLPEEDLLLVLLSGGGSSLLSTPLRGLDVEDLGEATRWLLASGLDIRAQNAVRKHLTACGGGRLARLRPAGRTRVLAISDVIADDPAVIASGPFSPDPTSFRDALDAIDATPSAGAFPERCRSFLERGGQGDDESPKSGDPAFRRVSYQLIASNRDALAAIAGAARREGWQAIVLQEPFRGEARRVGERLAALGFASARRCLWVAGGESTVRLAGESGLGGRNQELALAAARRLRGTAGVSVLACGTDGVDGPTDAAGACIDGTTWARMREAGRDPEAALARHDAYPALDAAGALVRTGPTETNVMDVTLVCRGSES